MIDTQFYNGASDNNSYADFDSIKYDKFKPRFKSILWRNYDWLKQIDSNGQAREVILDNVQRTLLCKTPYLGYDAYDCNTCDNWIWLFRHCHSRFCSSCGIKLQKILATKAEVMCIDVKHRHIVFTIPEEYRQLFRKDRGALDLLFIASRNTLMKIFNNSLFNKIKRSKGTISNPKDNLYLFRNYDNLNVFGEIATLHTFGRDLKWNPHIHALVPELIYDSKHNIVKHINHFNYESLRKTWQYEVNRLLLNRFGNKLKPLINNSYKKQDNGFYVYAKADISDKDDGKYTNNINNSKNVKGCVNYMMRYAGRPVMAENRLILYDRLSDEVVWHYTDHTTNETIRVYETGKQLLEKMIIHIPDKHFRMVRYYGFYNNKCHDTLDKINELLGKQKGKYLSYLEKKKVLKAKLDKLKFRTQIADTYNRDIFKCKCGGIFEFVYTYNPLERITNDREYRSRCIDEVRDMWIRGTGFT